MQPSRTLTTVLAWTTLIVAGLAVTGGETLAAGRGVCTSAVVEEPYETPDGAMHPPGTLTLCATREYSPVSWLHATYVDGQPVGLLISRRGSSEGRSGQGGPFVMLNRGPDGLLHLHGYAVPAGERMVTYELERARTGNGRNVAEVGGPGPNPAAPSTLALAARIH